MDKVMTIRDAERLKRWKKNHPDRYWEYLRQLGILSDGIIRQGPYEGINNCWLNEPAFVIGASQALKGIDLNSLNGLHTITVNHVIEDWDKSEFHLYLDQRFVRITSYNLENYQGTIFQKNNTQPMPHLKKVVRFKPRYKRDTIGNKIEDGLWNNCCAGVAALNLAIITGANPIYLLGSDSTTLEKKTGYHFKNGYTGEVNKDNGRGAHEKQKYYEKFIPYKNRIINVCNPSIATMHYFKTIDFNDINLNEIKKTTFKNKEHLPLICHIGVMNSIDEMGDITRDIFKSCYGKHLYIQYRNEIKNNIPKADLYFLHCFKNSFDIYRDFEKPEGSKVISIIHSSYPCTYAKCSDKVITLTDYYYNEYSKTEIKNKLIKIPAGIKNYLYKYPTNYEKNIICRMTRNTSEKIHPECHKSILELLNKYPDLEYRFFCDDENGTEKTNHERFKYRTDIKINMIEKKAYELSQCSIYAIANNDFIDTFSLSLLEAMASGLAIILLNNNQNAMVEVIGDSGIIVNNIDDWKIKIEELVNNVSLRIFYGEKAKKRAKLFESSIMIEKYNNLINEEIK